LWDRCDVDALGDSVLACQEGVKDCTHSSLAALVAALEVVAALTVDLQEWT
jgi:succinate dehydrogenase/fumarate reductase-like Fe-S protein